MKLFRSITLAASTAAICILPALAQQAPGVVDTDSRSAFIAQGHAPEIAPAHPITDAQRHQLSSLRDQFQLDNAQKKATLEVSKRQLHELLRSDSVDKGAALALQAKINGLRDDLSTSRLNMFLAMRDVFTPEQRAEFKAMRHHRHHRGGCGGGACGGHGGWGGHHHGGSGEAGFKGEHRAMMPVNIGQPQVGEVTPDSTPQPGNQT